MPHVSLESHQHQRSFSEVTCCRSLGGAMPSIWTYAKAAAVVVGSSAALLTGGIAHADPVPAVPDPMQNIPQQLIASVANAPQILQNFATTLGAQPPAAPATPGITFPGLTPAGGTAPASSPAVPGLSSIPGLTA